MEKLLHERLNDGYKSRPTGSCFVKVGDKYIELISDDALSIAREIERYYIPRPRFEDGEPVQFGSNELEWVDTVDYNPQTPWFVTAISKDGVPLATSGDKIVSCAEMTDGKLVKRPTPKIYDADGVEIKEGVVGFYYDGTKLRVLRVEPEVGDCCVYVRDRVTCCEYYIKPEKFTLKEPDSQQIINEDAEKLVRQLAEHYEIDDTVWISSSPMSPTLLDSINSLLERQRSLIERGA